MGGRNRLATALESIHGPRDAGGMLEERFHHKPLESAVSGFARADPHRFVQVGDKDLSVSDAAGLGRPDDRLDHLVRQLVYDDDLDLSLRHKLDGVFGSPVGLLVSLLAAEPADFRDGHAIDSQFGQGVLDLFQFDRLDNCFYFLHERILLYFSLTPDAPWPGLLTVQPPITNRLALRVD